MSHGKEVVPAGASGGRWGRRGADRARATSRGKRRGGRAGSGLGNGGPSRGPTNPQFASQQQSRLSASSGDRGAGGPDRERASERAGRGHGSDGVPPGASEVGRADRLPNRGKDHSIADKRSRQSARQRAKGGLRGRAPWREGSWGRPVRGGEGAGLNEKGGHAENLNDHAHPASAWPRYPPAKLRDSMPRREGGGGRVGRRGNALGGGGDEQGTRCGAGVEGRGCPGMEREGGAPASCLGPAACSLSAAAARPHCCRSDGWGPRPAHQRHSVHSSGRRGGRTNSGRPAAQPPSRPRTVRRGAEPRPGPGPGAG